MPDDSPVLTVYISYEYLAAEQLGALLVGLHGLYDELLYADAPTFRELPSSPAARLRIETVTTGQSITVSVVQGVTQLVASPDPFLAGIASGLAALSAAGLLVLRLFHRAEDLRAKVLRNNSENRHQRLEEARLELELGRSALELSASITEAADSRRAARLDTIEVLTQEAPERSLDQQEALAERLMPHLDAIEQVALAENVNSVRVTTPERDQ